jgi:hypothetical protein
VPCPLGDRTRCDDGTTYNWCVSRSEAAAECEQRCLTASDCRAGYSCQLLQGVADNSGICVGVCGSDEECGGGAVCNRQNGQCQEEPPSPALGLIGEACATSDDCASGACRLNTLGQNGAQTRWPGGYCVGTCRLPEGYNANQFYVGGTELPSGTCPETDVCFPGNLFSEGNLGTCFRGCFDDEECRSGYRCSFGPFISTENDTYDRGICIPG